MVFLFPPQEEVMEGELDDFTFVEINGMRLTEPAQVIIIIHYPPFPNL